MIARPEKLLKKPPKEIFDHWKKTLGNSINSKRFVNQLNFFLLFKDYFLSSANNEPLFVLTKISTYPVYFYQKIFCPP